LKLGRIISLLILAKGFRVLVIWDVEKPPRDTLLIITQDLVKFMESSLWSLERMV